MKAIIIDDERLARQELKNLLAIHKEVEVIAECSDAIQAKEKINELKPDIIFCDIQMPGKTGLELVEEISATVDVVFITAHDEHAIKAFKLNAFDYLLKPVKAEDLAETIKKLSIKEIASRVDNDTPLTEKDMVFIKDGDKCWFVKLSDIRLFESEGNYVRVYFDNFRPLILRSLNSLETRLNEKQFFRASRKHMINMSYIASVETWFNGGLNVKLKDGKEIEISRRQAVKLKDMMSL
ncbi:LytR/AlgR family response regulator transcription factor [Aurantibacillus circumpalustris]|uniref:LytR/AlgR family response regulator transcription factor n=1 Tax=Aurantibacillus circumpalustris TaxID=3036359 RepID=UPI00295AA73E|nr:response regulator [Aurantibacillus circumpalustris]